MAMEKAPHQDLLGNLPADLVLDIFLLCVPPFSTRHPISPHSGPLLISSICSSWRRLAIQCSRLWRQAHLRALPPAKLFLLLHLLIERSGTQPFAFRLDTYGSMYGDYDDLYCDLLSRMIEISPRLCALELGRNLTLSTFNHFRGYSLSNLKFLLIVYYPNGLEEPSSGSPLHALAGATRLQSLTFQSRSNNAFLSIPKVGTNLRHLSIDVGSVELHDLLRTLQGCQALISCSIMSHIYPFVDIGPDATRFVHLPLLTRFKLSSYNRVSHLLQHIEAPNLRHLEFHSLSPIADEISDNNPMTQFGLLAHMSSFIARHASRLEKLVFRWISFPGRELQCSLKDAHCLNELRFDDTFQEAKSYIAEALSALAYPGMQAQPRLAPKLEHIALMVQDRAHIDLLLDVISSRKNADDAVPIKVVSIVRGFSWDDPIPDLQEDSLIASIAQRDDRVRARLLLNKDVHWHEADDWAWDVVDV